jgi:MFS family permease
VDPILAVELNTEYGIDEDKVGFVFAVPFLIYIIGIPFINMIGDRLDRRITLVISFVIMGIGLVLQGPSKLFNLIGVGR